MRFSSSIRRSAAILATALCMAVANACGGTTGDRTTITIYTSIYEHVIAGLEPVLRDAFPDLEIRFFQRGSEDVAARLNSEIAAGKVGADLVMTSDPFWYQELKEAGHLLNYRATRSTEIPADLNDPDGAFATVRMPVMVMAANSNRVSAGDRPRTFSELAQPRWAGRITMGDPNRSGSFFTAVAALQRKYGWDYFEGLRKNDVVAAGGNSAVLNRVVTGEKDVGLILLENLLQAREQNPKAPIEIIYPDDGAILVPSPIAILKTTAAPEAAKRVYNFFLTDPGQQAIVSGWMYSPFRHIASPTGARPWHEVFSTTFLPWTPEYLRETTKAREDIKRRFNSIVLDAR
jgi:iron(III) transport system substrate-binding protein